MIIPECSLTDFHVHSTFSPDGKNKLDEICRQAREKGFRAIAITEHREVHPGWPGNFDVERYFLALEEVQSYCLSSGLRIYSGVELGNPQDNREGTEAFLERYPFDVVIASQHWLGEDNIHLEGCFQGRDPQAVYRRYFREIKRMATLCEFDILGHIDRIFWRGTERGTPPDLQALEGVIREALEALIRHKQALELNTRFLTHQPGWNQALLQILIWYHEQGGNQVYINSDAHEAGQMGRNFAVARNLLAQVRYPGNSFLVPVRKPVSSQVLSQDGDSELNPTGVPGVLSVSAGGD